MKPPHTHLRRDGITNKLKENTLDLPSQVKGAFLSRLGPEKHEQSPRFRLGLGKKAQLKALVW